MSVTEYTHDEQGHRVDVHRPSAINPGDYEYVRVDLCRKARVEGQTKLAGPAGTCHHCGKAIAWRVWFKHVPTGNLVTFGHQCAVILKMTDNRIDHEMNLLKRRAANEREQERRGMEKQEREDKFKAEHPDLYEFVMEFDEDNGFINRIKWGIDTFGSPLDHQIDSLKRFIAGREKLLVLKMEQAAKLENAPALEEGRQVIEGTVVGTKFSHNDYTGGMTKKMTVALDNGNRVFGTVPESIYEVEKGDRVQFTATVKPQEDHFGFYSRPTKATTK